MLKQASTELQTTDAHYYSYNIIKKTQTIYFNMINDDDDDDDKHHSTLVSGCYGTAFR